MARTGSVNTCSRIRDQERALVAAHLKRVMRGKAEQMRTARSLSTLKTGTCSGVACKREETSSRTPKPPLRVKARQERLWFRQGSLRALPFIIA